MEKITYSLLHCFPFVLQNGITPLEIPYRVNQKINNAEPPSPDPLLPMAAEGFAPDHHNLA